MTTRTSVIETEQSTPQLDLGAILLKYHQEVELKELEATVSMLRADNEKLQAAVTHIHAGNIRLRSEVANLQIENSRLLKETMQKTPMLLAQPRLFLSTAVTAGLVIFFLLSLCLHFLRGVLDIHWSTYAWGLAGSLGLLGEILLLAYDSARVRKSHAGTDRKAAGEIR